MRIAKYLQSLLSTGKGSDFSIFVLDSEGNKIEKKVHTIIIRQCPYFEAMLDLNGTEAKSGSVTIENIANHTFDCVLSCLYTDTLGTVTMEQATEVAVAADYLQLEDLKTAALDCWKASLRKLKYKKDVIEAFRALIVLPLNIKFDESWREASESLIIAIHDPASNFNIADESPSFIDFFINCFGVSHPCLAVHTLAKWASAKLTNEQQDERKKLSAELLKHIKLEELSLQTLAIISKTEAFPISYMIGQIQNRAEIRDAQTCDKVAYTLKMRTSRVLELEFEASYVLFRFFGFDNGNAWEFLHVPDKCKTKVHIRHPSEKDQSDNWKSHVKIGFVPAKGLRHFQNDFGEICFIVCLTLEGGDDSKFNYEIVYDDD